MIDTIGLTAFYLFMILAAVFGVFYVVEWYIKRHRRLREEVAYREQISKTLMARRLRELDREQRLRGYGHMPPRPAPKAPPRTHDTPRNEARRSEDTYNPVKWDTNPYVASAPSPSFSEAYSGGGGSSGGGGASVSWGDSGSSSSSGGDSGGGGSGGDDGS